jgi:hypothetical protein
MVRQPPLDDTSSDARRVQHELYASMTPSEKLTRMRELTMAGNQLALAGLAARHPGESRQQLLLRLARLRLGDDMVDRAYGVRDGA